MTSAKSIVKNTRRQENADDEHWFARQALRLRNLSIFQVMAVMINTVAAELWFIENRWPDGKIRCPRCGSDSINVHRSKTLRQFRCRACPGRYDFTVFTGSVMHRSKLPPLIWLWASYFVVNTPLGITPAQLNRYLGIGKDGQAATHLVNEIKGTLKEAELCGLCKRVESGIFLSPESQLIARRAEASQEWVVLPAVEKKPAGRLSVFDMMESIPNRDAAERRCVEMRWPDGEIRCPRCGSASVRIRRAIHPRQFRCRKCSNGQQYDFSVSVGTVMHASKLPPLVWLWAVYFMANTPLGVSSACLSRYLGISEGTDYHLSHRLRKAMEEPEAMPLHGVVEVDESVWTVGGLRGKVVMVVALERQSNQVRVVIKADRKKRTLKAFCDRNIDFDSDVRTDGLITYRHIFDGERHRWVLHSKGEYVRGDAHVNGVESFHSVMRRAQSRTFQSFSEPHLFRYAEQFAWRHNHRALRVEQRIALLVSQMEGKRLLRRDLRYPWQIFRYGEAVALRFGLERDRRGRLTARKCWTWGKEQGRRAV